MKFHSNPLNSTKINYDVNDIHQIPWNSTKIQSTKFSRFSQFPSTQLIPTFADASSTTMSASTTIPGKVTFVDLVGDLKETATLRSWAVENHL